MILGFFTRQPALLRPVSRLFLAVFLLTATVPATAGWFSQWRHPAPPTAPAAVSPTENHAPETTPAAIAAPITAPAITAAPLDPAALNSADLGNSDDSDAPPDADTETTPDAVADDAEQLPNVEESEIGEVDTPEATLDPADLAEKGDLWQRIRKGFQLDVSVDNERVATQRNWYAQHQDYLDRVALRGTRYLHYTVSEAEKRGLPTELALLPIIESAYDPFAYSHANAAGMWQFIPGTAKYMGVKLGYWFDGRRDVVESTRAAYDFLSLLYAKFNDWQLVLAAYNAGPGAVQRAINRNLASGLPTDFWSLRLPAETQAYVPRFIAVAQIIKAPETYGVTLRPVVDKPFFRSITTRAQVDMTAAAKIAGVSLKEMYQLNAGFNRSATDPEGPYRLLVPASLPTDFEEQIAALPLPNTVQAKTYRVKKGDTLFSLSKRFEVSTDEIKTLNKLRNNRLPVGRTITLARANSSPEYDALNREMRLVRAEVVRGSSGSKIYKVRRGDTLASIARKHGVSKISLARWNHLKPRSKVRAGQQLTVHTRAKKSHIANAKKNSKKNIASANGTRRISYKVKKGDTLFSISRRYNISVGQIKSWNNRAHAIQAGQGLVLFIPSSKRRNM